jgi:hypothetical protein
VKEIEIYKINYYEKLYEFNKLNKNRLRYGFVGFDKLINRCDNSDKTICDYILY